MMVTFLPALKFGPSSEEKLVKKEMQLIPVGAYPNGTDALTNCSCSVFFRVTHAPQALATVICHEK